MALYLGNNKISLNSECKIVKVTSGMKAFFDAGGKCTNSKIVDYKGIIHFDDTSNVTDMSYMFYDNQNLTTIPLIDTSNVTDMTDMFYGCTQLTKIPSFDVSNVTTFYNMFTRCIRLTAIHMTGINTSLDISSSTEFTREALVEIINNLEPTNNHSYTLTMGSTNLAKLTNEDKKIATDKGWKLE